MKKLLKIWLIVILCLVPSPLIYLLNRGEGKILWAASCFILGYCWLLLGMCLAVNYHHVLACLAVDENKFNLKVKHWPPRIRALLASCYYICDFKVRRGIKWLFFLLLVVLWGVIQFQEVFTSNVTFILALNGYTFVGIIIYMAKLLFGSNLDEEWLHHENK